MIASASKLAKSSFLGFLFSLIISIVIYYLAKNHYISASSGGYTVVVIYLILQILIMMRCFIGLNTKNSNGKWNALVYIFTLFIVAILVVGSFWIMHNLNYNMMH